MRDRKTLTLLGHLIAVKKQSKEEQSSLFPSLPVGERVRELLALLKNLYYPKNNFQSTNTLAYFCH
jgi:hypothetical protein